MDIELQTVLTWAVLMGYGCWWLFKRWAKEMDEREERNKKW